MNIFRRLYLLAINQAADAVEHLAYGLAVNINAEPIGTSGDALKLSPYFEGDYWEKEGQTWKKYRQVVTKAHAERIVAAFNVQRQKQGAHWRGLPIYRGHPDADKTQWPNEERLGGIMDVEAREDGIYVKVAWNEEGERNRRNGFLIYPSPAWPYDAAIKRQTGRIEPVELRSVGMVNAPRITESAAWTNSQPANPKPENTHTMPPWLLEKLIATGLLKKPADGATNSEAEVQTALSQLITNAAGKAFPLAVNGKSFDLLIVGDAPAGIPEEILLAINTAKQPLETKITGLEGDVKKFRDLAINSLKAEVINAGKVTAAEWPGFEVKLATNFDDTARELRQRQAAINTDALKLTKRHGDISTPAGRRLAFNARIDALVTEGCKNTDEAIDRMRGNPEDAALLKQMEG